jgi:hypothetical protein
MKKILLWTSVLCVTAAVIIAAIMLTSRGEEEEKLAPIEDPVFVYANLEQLATKGAFDKFITADNRRLIATALTSQVEDAELATQLNNIALDFNASGIDFRGRAYGYLSDDMESFAIVAKVLDINQVDNTIKLISYLFEDGGQEVIKVEQSDDTRTFMYKDITVSYNNSRIAFVRSNNDAKAIALEAITRAKSDMSQFAEEDIALQVNIERIISLASTHIESRVAELNDKLNNNEISNTHYTQQLDEVNSIKELINSYSQYFDAGAKVTISTIFDLGRATLAYNAEGINYGEYTTLLKPTNSNHLSALNDDAYVVMSIGVDGKVLSGLVNNLLDSDLLQNMGIRPTNEINMIFSIVCDALSTIDGGVTVALNEIKGSVKRTYNHYWDEYSLSPNIKSVEATIMADVTDSYIINNIAQFAGGFLRKVDATHYTLQLMNYKFSMGQDEQLFHLGVNMSPDPKTPSALDSKWAKDVEGSYGYFVANIDAMMNGDFLRSVNKIVVRNIIDEYRSIYTDSMEAISYIYASVKNTNSAEAVVVFDDISVNALEQINSIVLPVLVSEGIKAMI